MPPGVALQRHQTRQGEYDEQEGDRGRRVERGPQRPHAPMLQREPQHVGNGALRQIHRLAVTARARLVGVRNVDLVALARSVTATDGAPGAAAARARAHDRRDPRTRRRLSRHDRGRESGFPDRSRRRCDERKGRAEGDREGDAVYWGDTKGAFATAPDVLPMFPAAHVIEQPTRLRRVLPIRVLVSKCPRLAALLLHRRTAEPRHSPWENQDRWARGARP
jgi:hypothetical protein